MFLLKYLKKNISTKNTLDEIINTFEEMCKTPIEDDLLMHEYGVYAWTGKPMFYYDLVRQFSDDEDEYYQLRVSVVFAPDAENSSFEGSIWSDCVEGNFFDHIRKTAVYEYAKNHKFKSIDIKVDRT